MNREAVSFPPPTDNRRRKLTASQKAEIVSLVEDGVMPVAQIAQTYGIHISHLYRIIDHDKRVTA